MHDMKYGSRGNVFVCSLVLYQPQASSCVETGANDLRFPVDVTSGCMKPLVGVETLDLTW